MLRVMRNIGKDIQSGENIDLYLTIGVGMALAILNLFGVATSWTAPITLSVLALLAFSTLVNRQRLESVLESLGRSANNIFLEAYPSDFEKCLINSEELWIVGINLRRTITTYYDLFEEKLKRGHRIKILLIDPNGKSTDLLAGQSKPGYTPEEHRALIHLALSNLCTLKNVAPKKLEIRVIDYPIPYGFFFTNPSKAGTIYMKLYSVKMKKDIPIIIFKHDDGSWYEFYKRQVFTLWEGGTEWNYVPAEK